MQFEFRHEFDAPLDAIELAVLSPRLGQLLCDRMVDVESIEPREHHSDEDELWRVWRFQATAPLPALGALLKPLLRGNAIARDMLSWDERWRYRLREHRGSFVVVPRPGVDPEARWRKRFDAQGSYQLSPLSARRTRRTVSGTIEVHIELIGKLVERIAVKKLANAYDVEAGALRTLCNLT